MMREKKLQKFGPGGGRTRTNGFFLFIDRYMRNAPLARLAALQEMKKTSDTLKRGGGRRQGKMKRERRSERIAIFLFLFYLSSEQ